nr:DUF4062 domain-containing protein [uncultured Methanospirillum sp.]
MASNRIKIFISSRNHSPINFLGELQELSDVRKELKRIIEGITILGEISGKYKGKKYPLFKVFINEDEPPGSADLNSWEKCMQEVKSSDFVIAIIDGHAGWALPEYPLGICHDEYRTCKTLDPEKIYTIVLHEEIRTIPTDSGDIQRWENFWNYIEPDLSFTKFPKNGEELIEISLSTLAEALKRLVHKGSKSPSGKCYYFGQALEWSRLTYDERKQEIEISLMNSFKKSETVNPNTLLIPFKKKKVYSLFHGIPDSLSISHAKELVGQPFLYDYKSYESIRDLKAIGPIHIIGCHKTITESQALKMLGHPDVILVKAPFGLFLVDDIEKIQIIFIQNCRNQTETEKGMQLFFDWLTQKTDEVNYLITRAEKRVIIIESVYRVS